MENFSCCVFLHMLAFTAGLGLDVLIGDPVFALHPIRLIGHLILRLDRLLLDRQMRKEARRRSLERFLGFLMWLIVMLIVLIVSALLLTGAYLLHAICGILMEALLTWSVLAARSLDTESMRVYRALKKSDLAGARTALSMIVGRDTKDLSEKAVIRAAVETVAENTSDGVIAPLLLTFLGGPVFGLLYKAVNTMDSMVGYHNERYEDFGFFAAKADDVWNFIPARISAVFMLLAAALLPGCSFQNACRIYKRDRRKHKSPNSAQTESVMAGALGICLGGPSAYFGKIVEKPWIGDANREAEQEDIRRANRLMWVTAVLCAVCAELVLVLLSLQNF